MKDDAQLSIVSLILIVAMIIIIASIFIFLTLPPSCDESEQVELTGVLYGFEKNNTFWDVLLNNISYRFNYFDKSYMERLIGFNVTIICCDWGKHYDFLSAYINEKGE